MRGRLQLWLELRRSLSALDRAAAALAHLALSQESVKPEESPIAYAADSPHPV